MRVRDLLEGKSDLLITTWPEARVEAAAGLMAENDIGLLPVLGDSRRLAGVLSERDIARAVARTGGEIGKLRVRDIMSTEVMTAHPEDPLKAAMELMERRHIRHLPVVEADGRLVGILSQRDVLESALTVERDKAEAQRGDSLLNKVRSIGGGAPTDAPHLVQQTVAALSLRLVPLNGERALEHVALAENTHQTTVRFDDGKVADMAPLHQLHGRLERVLRVSRHHLGRHDIPDSQLPYFTARSSDRTRDIALGEHPREPPGIAQHRQPADVVLGHQPGRRLDPRLGPGGDQKITLASVSYTHLTL